ncbi:hypothetical protein GCM10011322_33310 [Salinarimonas ramus]|uniref:Uncharacterized protein n=1 Tax=Salinarimonas ramus TaxID=690164 RepID=A0A917V6L2_9HYPH|nr:hypothetical protein GCM10011322_33310 [Salinarimonas ramus]
MASARPGTLPAAGVRAGLSGSAGAGAGGSCSTGSLRMNDLALASVGARFYTRVASNAIQKRRYSQAIS